MINRQKFYQSIKDNGLFKSLSQKQVGGFDAILNEWEASKYTDIRWLAYELATVYHETGQTMQPVKEYGSEKYLKSKKYYPYYGRDFVQTTWLANYQKVQQFTGVNVVASPDLIADVKMASKVALHFMANGLYTGKSFNDYFNDKKDDPYNARRIINGTDCAEKIKGYYYKFLESIK